MLSLTSDYRKGTGNPEPYLRDIAATGFTQVHWCHQWNTDFLYSPCEVRQIARWFKQFGLALLDLHGSVGPEKCWFSLIEHERQAGVELVKNRIAMAARLGSDVVIMHALRWQPETEGNPERWPQLLRSLDALESYAHRQGVRLAIENMPGDDFAGLRRLFTAYGPDYLGLCYDSGHGNIGGEGLAHLDTVKDRLISIHLHDNNGSGDQHQAPLDGTVDWPRLAGILAASSYAKCISMESNMGSYGEMEEETFLGRAYERGMAVAEMVTKANQDCQEAANTLSRAIT